MPERVSITDAAHRLGVSKDTIRRRIKSGQLDAEKDNIAGQWWVLLPMGAQVARPRPRAPAQDAEGVAALRAHIVSLMQQVADLQRDRDRVADLLDAERRRVDRLIAALAERRERRPGPGLRRWLRRVWEGEGG